ncbi:nicotinamide N-methyltransferase-like [Lissotriton helveticus]
MEEDLSIQSMHEKYYDSKFILETYYNPQGPFLEDLIMLPLKQLEKAFTSCDVKGDLLIGLSLPPIIYQYLPACESFREVIVAQYTENSLQEIKKWWKKEPGAFDWAQLLKLTYEAEDDRKKWVEKEEMLKKTIKCLLKFDVVQSNPLAPGVFPEADCILALQCLEFLCLSKENYCCALKNIASLLKTEGFLVMFGLLGCTFRMTGTRKLPVLCMDEEFLRCAIRDAGYVIKSLEVNERVEKNLFSVSDANALFLLIACKRNDIHLSPGVNEVST